MVWHGPNDAKKYHIESEMWKAIRHDYDLLMHFFCNEWNGGCRVDLMPENVEAYNVFSIAEGYGIPANDVMELERVSDKADCWERYKVLKSEFMKCKRSSKN